VAPEAGRGRRLLLARMLHIGEEEIGSAIGRSRLGVRKHAKFSGCIQFRDRNRITSRVAPISNPGLSCAIARMEALA